MRYRVLTVLLLLAATIVITPGTACACTCAILKPAEQVTLATAVFTGTVVAARPLKGDPLGGKPPIVYTFRADQVYKGDVGVEYEVMTNVDSAACGYNFERGTRYLVFASDKETGMFPADSGVPLRTTLCSGDQPVRPGEGPLRARDGIQNGEPLSAELLSALGTATRPQPTSPSPSAPSPAGASSPLSASPWIYVGGAAVLLGLAFAGLRLFSRRRP